MYFPLVTTKCFPWIPGLLKATHMKNYQQTFFIFKINIVELWTLANISEHYQITLFHIYIFCFACISYKSSRQFFLTRAFLTNGATGVARTWIYSLYYVITFTISLNSLLVKTTLVFHLTWFEGRALPPFTKGGFLFTWPTAKKNSKSFPIFSTH